MIVLAVAALMLRVIASPTSHVGLTRHHSHPGHMTAALHARRNGAFARRMPSLKWPSSSLSVRSRPPSRSPDEETREMLENELKDPSNFLEYFLPRGVRKWLLAAGATSAGIGSVLSFVNAVTEKDAFEARQTAINLLGTVVLSLLLKKDLESADARIEKRREVREKQISRGDRTVYRNEDGMTVSRLNDVDLTWILKRLERWGSKDQMPFVGPKKGAILQQLIAEHRPKKIVEVGTLAGYSALLMGEKLLELDAGNEEENRAAATAASTEIITIEKDWLWWLVANRFVFQAGDGTPELKGKIRVWLGDASKKLMNLPSDFMIDFLFLDGIPSEYLSYLKAAEPHLAPGALIVADNAGVFASGGLKNYLEYVRGSHDKFESRYIESTLEWRDDVPDGFEVTKYCSPSGGSENI